MSLEIAIMTLAVCYGVVVTILYSSAWIAVQIIKRQHQNKIKQINTTIQQSNVQMKTMVARLQGTSTLEDVDKVLADFGIVRLRKKQ